MNRIDRLVAILTTLQSKKYVKAEFIAEKYRISIRTVYRDLKALGEMGVPLSFENKKGYSIMQGFFLAPVSLTSEEANALILLVSLSEKFADTTIKKNADNALDKIKSVLKSSEKEKAEYLYTQIRIYQPQHKESQPDYLTDIQNAIVDKSILEICYVDNEGQESQREIEPIGLTFYSNQWHLIAWCWKRRDYRDFKVQQISSLDSTKEKFRKSTHLDINGYINSIS